MITKPTTKFALVDTQGVVVDGATEIDVTNDVGSWKELEIEQCREDTTGVISEVSFPITFHFAAKELLEKLFEANGFYAEALFRVYKRADFSDDYTLVREMRLDFSTYKADRNGVEIESINDDLAEYISSRKSTKYDIKVSEIADSKKWRYERMTLLNRGTWSIASWDGNPDNMAGSVIQVADGRIGTLRMNKNAVEMTPGGAENKFSDQEWTDFVMADSPTAGVYKLETDFYQRARCERRGRRRIAAVDRCKDRCQGLRLPFARQPVGRSFQMRAVVRYGRLRLQSRQSVAAGRAERDPSIHWEWNIHWTSAGDPDLEEHFNVSNIILRRGERLAFAVINDKTSTLVPHDDYIRVWDGR
ncbi:MAG: hypothetical protein ACLR8Y_04135 [Alistipes indistinctus]